MITLNDSLVEISYFLTDICIDLTSAYESVGANKLGKALDQINKTRIELLDFLGVVEHEERPIEMDEVDEEGEKKEQAEIPREGSTLMSHFDAISADLEQIYDLIKKAGEALEEKRTTRASRQLASAIEKLEDYTYCEIENEKGEKRRISGTKRFEKGLKT